MPIRMYVHTHREIVNPATLKSGEPNPRAGQRFTTFWVLITAMLNGQKFQKWGELVIDAGADQIGLADASNIVLANAAVDVYNRPAKRRITDRSNPNFGQLVDFTVDPATGEKKPLTQIRFVITAEDESKPIGFLHDPTARRTSLALKSISVDPKILESAKNRETGAAHAAEAAAAEADSEPTTE